MIFASILAHSSTDVPIAHAFARAEARRDRAAVPDAGEGETTPTHDTPRSTDAAPT